MKFSEKYPNMKPIHEEIDAIIRGTTLKPCHWCKSPTEYVDINYEGPFCSDECLYEFEDSIF